MKSSEIRQQFFDFFISKGHKIYPSAPIVNQNDPTLMFTNAGMNQFKDFFLGNQVPPYTRIADTQKCLRVSGKHNDLEDVGLDSYHHTMFEMLGNWSFGDYFKKEAISWAWELLTDVYKIPHDRLYVTIFGGDEKEGLTVDEESADIWKRYVAEDRILEFGKKDNFWEMGDTGPCGPCTEIHVDMRSDEDRATIPGSDFVNMDHPLVIEIWNNVFIQYNRKADGSLEQLPAKHVDTGMGFERLCMVLQGKKSNYDSDIFSPFINKIEEISGKTYTAKYSPDAKSDIAFRVNVDHLRAVAFTIGDGALPGSSGAGYVVRRILRRAVRYYFTYLDVKEPMLYKLVSLLADTFKHVFPELKAQEDLITRIILEEEKSFLRTLDAGLKRIDQLQVTDNMLDGNVAFELYDTFGFPVDLTRLIASDKGWTVDEKGFEIALTEQKERSRSDAQKQVGDWINIRPDLTVTFIGYDQTEAEGSKIIKYRTVEAKNGSIYQLVLDKTPFYAESGGQVGDTGTIWIGTQPLKVLDTQKENNLIIHIIDRLPEDPQAEVRSMVDATRRKLIEANHSATHLLHAALRNVLGTHVQQKGSLLDENRLRFDFSHFQKMTDDEIMRVEQEVNSHIRQNIALREDRSIPIEQAKEAGAMMLFGEKYGEQVRMITFDPSYSRELCGGCHVAYTGKIGYFKIVSETGIAAGVRRIEAMTGAKAEVFVADKIEEFETIKSLLPGKDQPVKNVISILEHNKSLQKEIEKLTLEKAHFYKSDIIRSMEHVNGFSFYAGTSAISDDKALKTILYEIDNEYKNVMLVIGYVSDEKPKLMVLVSQHVVSSRSLHAGQIVKQLAQYIKGGGGGQPFFATSGGSDVSGLQQALDAARQIANEAKG